MGQTITPEPSPQSRTPTIVLIPDRFAQHMRDETLAGRLGLAPGGGQ